VAEVELARPATGCARLEPVPQELAMRAARAAMYRIGFLSLTARLRAPPAPA
jgi:hypothetical protein